MKNHRKKLALSMALLLTMIVVTLIINNRTKEIPANAEGSAHLTYIQCTVKDVRDESVVVRVLKEITDEEFYPKVGENIYLFIPLESMQHDILANFSEGDDVSVSLNDLDTIHMDNGLYSIVIMNSSQINKID